MVFSFFAECSPSSPFIAYAAWLPEFVFAVMQHWGETEAESAVPALHSPEMEGCFAVAELCFSCAAWHCCSSGLRFSAGFSGVSAVVFSFFTECSPSSPFLALVSVAEEAFSMAAFSFFAECSPSLSLIALVSVAEEAFSMAALSFFSK